MVKRRFIIWVLLITLLSSCNFYGDIKLGAEFYYMVDPDFNSIGIPVNPKKPYRSSIYIIRNIETIGYNKTHILATSLKNDTLRYWVIDKTKEATQLGIDGQGITMLSNVNEISIAEFARIESEKKIEVRSKNDYRKDAHYE